MKPSATSVLETAPMYSVVRDALSLIVCERAPWRVKCSVVSAVSSSCLSAASAMQGTLVRAAVVR